MVRIFRKEELNSPIPRNTDTNFSIWKPLVHGLCLEFIFKHWIFIEHYAALCVKYHIYAQKESVSQDSHTTKQVSISVGT